MYEDQNNPDLFFLMAMAPPEKSFQYFFVDTYRVTNEDNFTKDLDITFEVPSVFNYKRTYLAKRIIDYNYKELVVA